MDLLPFPSLFPWSASQLFSDALVLSGTVAGKQGLSWDPTPYMEKDSLDDPASSSMFYIK